MKKLYMKPQMKAIRLKPRHPMLLVTSADSQDGLKWKKGGFDEDESDM